ncbi:contractile injection system tape measure protein, partial [Flavobacteriaceae bacterium]|nr:contractile injection system tape measure protein [Flavobacteriaceae bacterium]
LSAEKISSKTFFDKQLDTEEELPLQMSNFLSSLKRNYANFKNQLSEELFLKEEQGGLEEENETDSIVIQNAGLIILWPFFFRLFDKCGFIIDKEFKDEESLQKGILLTQYLVTGSTEFNENELVLNKILCGAPQFMNVDVTLEFDEVYLDLCESLLKGVLKNWEKLSNSSVQTLRETFLIREGILRPVELDYKLNVIKGTFDMLIETIPWNISIIQTTFMKNKINVDWK